MRPTELSREGNPAMRISEIREQIGRGEYRVDTQAVADAVLRRLARERKLLRAQRRNHNQCSYPKIVPAPSENESSAGPSSTRPIQVSEQSSIAAFAAAPRLDGETHTQSS